MRQRAWLTITGPEIAAAPQLFTWTMAFFLCIFIGTSLDRHGALCWNLTMTEDGAGFTCRWRWSREFQEDHAWARPSRHAWLSDRT